MKKLRYVITPECLNLQNIILTKVRRPILTLIPDLMYICIYNILTHTRTHARTDTLKHTYKHTHTNTHTDTQHIHAHTEHTYKYILGMKQY